MPSPSCISCGYSLAGLARESLCPECAFPVARSLDATPLLRTADPRWLARVASGFRALDRSMACWLAAVCLWIPILLIGVMFVVGRSPSSPAAVGSLGSLVMGTLAVIMALVVIASLLFAAYGLWAASSPTPSHHAPPRWARFVLRWCAAPLALLAVALVVLNSISLTTFGVIFTYILRAAVQITGIASLLALSRLLKHFELALPDPRPDLARRVKNTRKNLAALVFIFAFGWCQTFFYTGPVTVSMSLGLAPIFLAIGFMCFQTTITRTHKGITAELAAATSSGGMLKSS